MDDNEEFDVVLEPLCTPQTISVGSYIHSPVEIVKQLVNRPPPGLHSPCPVFCEMYELNKAMDSSDYHWKESCRWIKYEETVEEGGKRWSKPHITLLNLPSLLQLRNCLKRGVILLDLSVKGFQELIDAILAVEVSNENKFDEMEFEQIIDALISPKYHLVRSQFRDRTDGQNLEYKLLFSMRQSIMIPSDHLVSVGSAEDGDDRDDAAENSALNQLSITSTSSIRNGSRLRAALSHGANAVPIQSGAMDRRASTNERLFRKLKQDTEAANIFIGKLEGIRQPFTAFVRLNEARTFQDIPEMHLPTRFFFLLLVPDASVLLDADEYRDVASIGKAMGVLFADQIFSSLAYRCRDATELCAGVDEFVGQTTLIPAGHWSADNRLEPTQKTSTTRGIGPPSLAKKISVLHAHDLDPGLRRTGIIFGGLIQDVRRKSHHYLSDIRDAFRPSNVTQCLAATLFLFFANITKIITFGGVMEVMLKQNMAAMENLVSGGICGVLYALFSGQPLAVLSATGPVLVFESILFNYCESVEWGFLESRFWVGAWTALFIIFLIASDASVIVALITKFTEEAFATLISLIFIIQAFEELLHISHFAPITPSRSVEILMFKAVISDPCICKVPSAFNDTSSFADDDHKYFATVNTTSDPFSSYFASNYSKEECKDYGGRLSGKMCHFHPDVFPFAVCLFVGTFLITYGLKHFRQSGYLPNRIRNTVADFNVVIAIISMTALNYFVGLDVPTLNVPSQFRPTSDRGWFINPLNVAHWWVPLAAAIPALFFTVLVVIDQQITSVIVNRKENKLKKGFGYHLDLLVIALLMIICSWMGIPYYVAATVISIMHVESLRTMTEATAPGEKPHHLGVREQRMSALFAHVLIGMAVFLTPVMRLVPFPVLLGIFLYTGIVALSGQEFAQRVTLFFMPSKYQPDFRFLRLVPLSRVHLFTFVQLICLALLFVVKHTSQISMLFPIMLVFMMLARKLIERLFKAEELLALDDPLPSWAEIMRTAKDPMSSRGSFNHAAGDRKLSNMQPLRQTTIAFKPDLENSHA